MVFPAFFPVLIERSNDAVDVFSVGKIPHKNEIRTAVCQVLSGTDFIGFRDWVKGLVVTVVRDGYLFLWDAIRGVDVLGRIIADCDDVRRLLCETRKILSVILPIGQRQVFWPMFEV